MSVFLITLLLFLSMIILLAMGVPVAFTLGSIGFIFAIILWGPQALYIGAAAASGQIMNSILIAVPLFVFMGSLLERTGIADDLYDMMHIWLGPINGGLAMGTVLICTAFGAMTGITGTATVTMGLLALPSMLKRRYDSRMAIGCISAGGALGVLIPPSVVMIIYALFSGESVGGLFAGGLFPGLLLSFLFNIYIFIRGLFQPHLCPAIPHEERVNWQTKFIKLRGAIFPIALIIAVLGSIFFGIATPTEASAVGALGGIVAAVVHRKLTWENLKQASINTLKISCMVMWILVGASIFVAVYSALGAPELVKGMVMALEVSKWYVLIGIQIIWFLLGAMLDPIAIIMITIPVFLPVIKSLGFDPLWFGVIFVVNMEMSYLTPPFGMNLFYMKGVVPKGINMADIYRSITPFVMLQAVGLILCLIFPKIVLWLPSMIFSK